jgi:hypothetical protein
LQPRIEKLDAALAPVTLALGEVLDEREAQSFVGLPISDLRIGDVPAIGPGIPVRVHRGLP